VKHLEPMLRIWVLSPICFSKYFKIRTFSKLISVTS
jgi:hypothetical protein